MLKEEQGFGDAPATKGISDDVHLIFGGHFGSWAVPLQDALFKAIDHLDEGHLEVQTGVSNWLANRLAELGNDDLLHLIHGVEAGVDKDEQGQDDESDKNGWLHGEER